MLMIHNKVFAVLDAETHLLRSFIMVILRILSYSVTLIMKVPLGADFVNYRIVG